MASFDAEESSLENSQPVEIYRILLGSQSFYYTSSEDTVTVVGIDYTPLAGIQRSAIVRGKTERNKTLTIKIPATSELAQEYVLTPPGRKAVLQIFRAQRGDVSFTPKLIYDGVIKSAIFPANGQLCELTVQTSESATSQQIPRYTYMSMCNHVLYGAGCDVDPTNFQHSGVVTSVSGTQITISGLAASGLDFTGGYVASPLSTEFRLVLAQSSDTLTLLLAFQQDYDGSTVTAFAGCDHSLFGDCTQVFSNETEFGGFAFVPNRNPFTGGL